MWRFLNKLYSRFDEIDGSRHAAAIAYYTIFSMSPLVLVIILIAGAVYGNEAVTGKLYSDIEGTFGHDSASLIQSLVASAKRAGGSVFVSIMSGAIMLFGASIVLHALQDALDAIWEVHKQVKSTWITYLKRRFLSVCMALIIGVIFLMSIVLSSFFASLSQYSYLFGSTWINIAWLLDLGLAFMLNIIIFTSIYKFLPSIKVKSYYALIGGVIASTLFVIGKLLIGIYIAKAGISTTFGVAGSLVVILLWVYYLSQIILIGALVSKELSDQSILHRARSPRPTLAGR